MARRRGWRAGCSDGAGGAEAAAASHPSPPREGGRGSCSGRVTEQVSECQLPQGPVRAERQRVVGGTRGAGCLPVGFGSPSVPWLLLAGNDGEEAPTPAVPLQPSGRPWAQAPPETEGKEAGGRQRRAARQPKRECCPLLPQVPSRAGHPGAEAAGEEKGGPVGRRAQEQSGGSPEGGCRGAPALVSLSRNGPRPPASSPLGNRGPGLSPLQGRQQALDPAALNQTSLPLQGERPAAPGEGCGWYPTPTGGSTRLRLRREPVLGSSSSEPVAPASSQPASAAARLCPGLARRLSPAPRSFPATGWDTRGVRRATETVRGLRGSRRPGARPGARGWRGPAAFLGLPLWTWPSELFLVSP